MYILGLSGNFSTERRDIAPSLPEWFYHDATACLVRDGELVAAVEEERLNRIKKTTKFPTNAVRAVLDTAGIGPEQIDGVAYCYDQEFVDQMLNELNATQPSVPTLHGTELIQQRLHEAVGLDLAVENLHFARHHDTHARSVLAASAFDDALVVAMDGRGERESGTIYSARSGQLEQVATHGVFDSLGSFYEFGTQLLGYGYGDEYKVMGLAPHGDPSRYRHVFDAVYVLSEAGRYSVIPRTLGFHPFAAAFLEAGMRPRRKGEPFTQQHKDFAAGLQEAFERIFLHVVKHWRTELDHERLCFTGGIAHNSTLNGRILSSGLFDEVFVHPASHDAGAAEGAALDLEVKRTGAPIRRSRPMTSASLGPDIGTDDEVRSQLEKWTAFVDVLEPDDVITHTADALAGGDVIAWVQGRSEFGPRALGNRSILADPRPRSNQARINSMIKQRESYRPFAPVVTAERAREFFDLTDTTANFDFMSYVAQVRPEWQERLGAVTHVDGTARVQALRRETNPELWELLNEFAARAEVPVLLNTSYNNNVEPIVQDVNQAVACFLTTELDQLVIGRHVVTKRDPLPLELLRCYPYPYTRVSVTTEYHDTGAVSTPEVWLDYINGRRVTVSQETADVFASLRPGDRLVDVIDEDEPRTKEILADFAELWAQRVVELRP